MSSLQKATLEMLKNIANACPQAATIQIEMVTNNAD